MPERNYSADFLNQQSARTNVQTPQTPETGQSPVKGLSPDRSLPTLMNPPEINLSIGTGSALRINSNPALELVSNVDRLMRENDNSAMPSITDTEVSSLTALCDSEFLMPATDPDFKISHEQLIKVCKILLFRNNLQTKKTIYERKTLAKAIEERIAYVENASKSQVRQVNQFLNTVHQDFEDFVEKHKKEHVSINARSMSAAEEL